jgi:hypothetical protein
VSKTEFVKDVRIRSGYFCNYDFSLNYTANDVFENDWSEHLTSVIGFKSALLRDGLDNVLIKLLVSLGKLHHLKRGNWRALQSKKERASKPIQLHFRF